jgi:FkbM family methyltransferase
MAPTPPRLGGLAERIRGRGARTRLDLRRLLAKTVTVRHDGHEYSYRCATFDEYMRAHSLFWKEPGTFRLITAELRPGDVFHDIGANMGIYSIPAARRVGEEGVVYAFEPHVGNAQSLLENVQANGLQDRVRVISCALHEASGFFDFKYQDLTAGTSMSQLESDRDAFGRELRPVASELKYAIALDDLVEGGTVRTPDLVKIDVDGNELLVLRGMRRLLTGERRPRAVQVEVNVDEREELEEFMASCRYELAERHLTEGIQRQLDAGADPATLPFNGIFRP